MKLVSYRCKSESSVYRIGFIQKDKVTDLQESYRLLLLHRKEDALVSSLESLFPADPTRFFKNGEKAMAMAREAHQFISKQSVYEEVSYPREKVMLGPPIADPGKIICVGKNYADHAKEMDSALPEYPVLFSKFSNALIGPEDVIEKSPQTNQLDYEVELVVVIGREASQVSQSEAYNYIAGYTIGNDVTARDMQNRTSQWLQGKSIDRSTPIGPWVVTSDEMVNPENLNIVSFINGEQRQASTTNQFIFNIPFLIEYISHLITLQPGDIILTGTPDGVGVAMNPPQFLVEHDQITLEIEGIGKLENKVTERK